jgi:hypothetical protein
VASARRDAQGLVIINAIAAGTATIELVDAESGIDSLTIEVQPIQRFVRSPDSNVVLAGTPIGARVFAEGTTSGGWLSARGALVTKTAGALARQRNTAGYYFASSQTAVIGWAPGDATVSFETGDVMVDVPYRVVERSQLTGLVLGERFFGPASTVDARDRNRVYLFADAYADGERVRGGPSCDWSIASGTGGVAAYAADDLNRRWLDTDTAAIVYGSGDVIVECRASDTLVAEITVRLHP